MAICTNNLFETKFIFKLFCLEFEYETFDYSL